jgi:hypothetical protein
MPYSLKRVGLACVAFTLACILLATGSEGRATLPLPPACAAKCAGNYDACMNSNQGSWSYRLQQCGMGKDVCRCDCAQPGCRHPWGTFIVN